MTHRDETSRFTHCLQYRDAAGTWHYGHLGYTASEARGVARAARQRTGREVRVVTIPERSVAR